MFLSPKLVCQHQLFTCLPYCHFWQKSFVRFQACVTATHQVTPTPSYLQMRKQKHLVYHLCWHRWSMQHTLDCYKTDMGSPSGAPLMIFVVNETHPLWFIPLTLSLEYTPLTCICGWYAKFAHHGTMASLWMVLKKFRQSDTTPCRPIPS